LICPRCLAELKPIAFIEDPDIIYRILKHSNLLENETEQEPSASPKLIGYFI
jgi:hypothetical protein